MMRISVQGQPANPAMSKQEQSGKTAKATAKANGNAAGLQHLEIEAAKAVMVLKLTAETIDAAWKELESWKPAENKTPSQNVQDLNERYRSIRDYISALEPADEGLQAQLLLKLERLITQHLEGMILGQYGDLAQFLLQNGQESAISAIKSSLLFFILDKIAQQENLWPPEYFQQRDGGKNRFNSISRSADNGMLQYSPGGKTNLRASVLGAQGTPGGGMPLAHGSRVPEAPMGAILSYTSKNSTPGAQFSKPFTLPELEISNVFAKHMKQYSMAGQLTASDVEREEWIGVKSGVAWLKTQLFAGTAGISKTMAYVMQNAVENQIFTAIHQAAAALKSANSGPGMKDLQRFAPLEQEAVYSVFNHFVREYREHRNAEKTIMDSIFFMLEVLKKKDQELDYQSMFRYQNQMEWKGGPRTDLANACMNDTFDWLRQVKSSWDQFIKDMKFSSGGSLDFSHFQEDYSVWVQTMKPDVKPSDMPEVSLNTMLKWFGIGLLAVMTFLLYATHG